MSDMGIAEMTRGLEAGVLRVGVIRGVLSQVERDQALNIWLEVKPLERSCRGSETSDERRAEGKL